MNDDVILDILTFIHHEGRLIQTDTSKTYRYVYSVYSVIIISAIIFKLKLLHCENDC